MDAQEHLSRIEQLLNELQSAKKLVVAETILKSINRSANYLSKVEDRKHATLMLLCVDLAELVRGEKALAESAQQKTLSEGFFKSFSVLRAEFKKAVAAIRG